MECANYSLHFAAIEMIDRFSIKIFTIHNFMQQTNTLSHADVQKIAIRFFSLTIWKWCIHSRTHTNRNKMINFNKSYTFL